MLCYVMLCHVACAYVIYFLKDTSELAVYLAVNHEVVGTVGSRLDYPDYLFNVFLILFKVPSTVCCLFSKTRHSRFPSVHSTNNFNFMCYPMNEYLWAWVEIGIMQPAHRTHGPLATIVYNHVSTLDVQSGLPSYVSNSASPMVASVPTVHPQAEAIAIISYKTDPAYLSHFSHDYLHNAVVPVRKLRAIVWQNDKNIVRLSAAVDIGIVSQSPVKLDVIDMHHSCWTITNIAIIIISTHSLTVHCGLICAVSLKHFLAADQRWIYVSA